MAREWWRGLKCCCSYKRTTIALCCVNLVAALYLFRSLYTISSSPSSHNPIINRFSDLKYTEGQIKRMEESIRVRREAEPIELVRLVKELKKEISRGERKWKLTLPLKQILASEILQRLDGLKDAANVTEQREAVDLWRAEKLKAFKSLALSNSTSNPSVSAKDAKMLKIALESDWLALSEEIGLWMPADIINNEINDKPESEPEDEEIIPGPPLPPECHAEPHSDYDGAAVRWGLTHHKDSAADCCQACLDQAKNAKPGQMKCNIWVYCPSESGCYSPDMYEHKHQECWLKQSNKPKLTFKAKYSEAYRNSHPAAPEDVPWIAGVISS